MKDRAQIAQEHTDLMARMFSEEIKESLEGSQVDCWNPELDTEIVIENMTTEQAVVKYSGYNTGVLNFASYIRPGGGFITGSTAQEEAICHASTLYNVLKEFKEEYNTNYERADRKTGEYRNWSIYSPNIIFYINEEDYQANVLTCPAPNASHGLMMNPIYQTILAERICYALNIFKEHSDKTLILGAFGCGVFKNDPKIVALLFKHFLSLYDCFSKVVFAIPGGKNLEEFKKVFE